jgi:hypothetical protein
VKFLVDAQFLFVRHEEALFRLLAQHEFIELSRNQVIVHR